MRKVIGYAYHNGMWYRQYASGKMEACSEQEIVEHIKRVEKSREAENEEEQCDDDCEHCEWVTCPKMEEEE